MASPISLDKRIPTVLCMQCMRTNGKEHADSGQVPELSGAQVERDYYIRFVCPRCFRSKWALKRNLGLTLDEVLDTLWEFECPVHGPLREKPLQATEIKPIVLDEKQ